MQTLNEKGCECLFAGGGKGTFICDDDAAADNLKKRVIKEAHLIGLDIRFGKDSGFANASRNATELFPFFPDLPDGMPCPVSGLYPVKKDSKQGHPIVRKRIFSQGTKMFRWFETMLLEGNDILGASSMAPDDLSFFANVDADDTENRREGQIGAKTLGIEIDGLSSAWMVMIWGLNFAI